LESGGDKGEIQRAAALGPFSVIGFLKTSARGSRRNNRLFWRQLRQAGGTFFAVALVLGAVTYGWVTGSFGLARDWAVAHTLDVTRRAGFQVQDIFVTGRVNASAEQIAEKLNAPPGLPILALDLGAAKTALETLPWVESARITRELPGTLRIDLTERQPIALWQYRQKLTLIDRNGFSIAESDLSRFSGLPLFIGAEAQKQAPALMNLFAAEPDLTRHVVSSSWVGGRRWDVLFDTGVTAKLPENDMELAFRKLATAQEKHNILGQNLGVIDLRLPEKMVLTPAQAKPVASLDSKRT
jgi:cell division protein FtsQ